MKKLLLIIDPQVDFCDIPAKEINNYQSSLPVFGAHEDMKRLSKIINNYDFSDIMVSLDNHNSLDISLPSWWRNEEGSTPKPFTVITASQVYQEIWKPVDNEKFWYAYDYLSSLYEKNKQHIIWPEHCIINSVGAEIHPVLKKELLKWEKYHHNIRYIKKGLNPLTEHYSLFQAESPIEEDQSTQIDIYLMNTINQYDFIFIAGEVLSHCVKSSIMDLLDYVPAEKLVLLLDATSCVNGFEKESSDFIKFLKDKGIILMTTKELML